MTMPEKNEPGVPHEAFKAINIATNSRYGPMLVNANDLYVGEAYLHCGEYSEHEVAFLRAIVRPGDVAVMAGANIGSLVVPIAQTIGNGGRILAFEPQLHVYHLLCANVALNDLTNVECFRYAVGAERGVINVPRIDPTQKINTGGVSMGEGTDAVPMLSVDSMGLLALDLLQADVEGFEMAVLEGAEETIARDKPVLYLEADRAGQRGPLLTWLVDAGYHVWEHTPPLWNPENFLAETEVRWENVVSVNWLCVHPKNARPTPESAHLRQLWPAVRPQPFVGMGV